MCLHDNRMAEAIILAIAGGPELLAQTQKKFFSKNRNNLTRVDVMLNIKQIIKLLLIKIYSRLNTNCISFLLL